MKQYTEAERQALISRAKDNIKFLEAAHQNRGHLFDSEKENLSLMQIALAVLESTAVVTDGWKLVPVEPTDEMVAAGDAYMDGLSSLSEAYEAMIEAAPVYGGEVEGE